MLFIYLLAHNASFYCIVDQKMNGLYFHTIAHLELMTSNHYIIHIYCPYNTSNNYSLYIILAMTTQHHDIGVPGFYVFLSVYTPLIQRFVVDHIWVFLWSRVSMVLVVWSSWMGHIGDIQCRLLCFCLKFSLQFGSVGASLLLSLGSSGSFILLLHFASIYLELSIDDGSLSRTGTSWRLKRCILLFYLIVVSSPCVRTSVHPRWSTN